MALDASNFPSEGTDFNTEQLLPDVAFILQNMNGISKQIGAKKPYVIPKFDKNSNTDQYISSNVATDIKLTQNSSICSIDNIQSNHYPSNMDDRIYFKYETPAYPEQSSNIEPLYFKDGAGNQYKSDNGTLYVLGWQDTDLQVRLVSEKSRKIIPTNGKKFQIYGWHTINKMNASDVDTKISNVPCVSNIEKTMNYVANDYVTDSNQNCDTTSCCEKSSHDVCNEKMEIPEVKQEENINTNTVTEKVDNNILDKPKTSIEHLHKKISGRRLI